jgi:hypothetical protein
MLLLILLLLLLLPFSPPDPFVFPFSSCFYRQSFINLRYNLSLHFPLLPLRLQLKTIPGPGQLLHSEKAAPQMREPVFNCSPLLTTIVEGPADRPIAKTHIYGCQFAKEF